MAFVWTTWPLQQFWTNAFPDGTDNSQRYGENRKTTVQLQQIWKIIWSKTKAVNQTTDLVLLASQQPVDGSSVQSFPCGQSSRPLLTISTALHFAGSLEQNKQQQHSTLVW